MKRYQHLEMVISIGWESTSSSQITVSLDTYDGELHEWIRASPIPAPKRIGTRLVRDCIAHLGRAGWAGFSRTTQKVHDTTTVTWVFRRELDPELDPELDSGHCPGVEQIKTMFAFAQAAHG